MQRWKEWGAVHDASEDFGCMKLIAFGASGGGAKAHASRCAVKTCMA